MTEPLCRAIRRILPAFGALDLSPMVVLLLIIILQRVVGNLQVAAPAGA